MSLVNPNLKMSKSHANPKSRIMIIDSYDEIQRKIKSAVTDSIPEVSYEPEKRPGVSNLVEIMYHLQDDHQQTSPEELAKDCQGLTMRALKERVAHCIDRHLADIRESYLTLTEGSNKKRLDDAATLGTSKANDSANATMNAVRNAIGL